MLICLFCHIMILLYVCVSYKDIHVRVSCCYRIIGIILLYCDVIISLNYYIVAPLRYYVTILLYDYCSILYYYMISSDTVSLLHYYILPLISYYYVNLFYILTSLSRQHTILWDCYSIIYATTSWYCISLHHCAIILPQCHTTIMIGRPPRSEVLRKSVLELVFQSCPKIVTQNVHSRVAWKNQ